MSRSPIAACKACNMIQAVGIAYSKIVLPSGDSKGESKGRTYWPTTWNYSYTWQHAADYADQLRQVGTSALLCQECTLLVKIQLSKKSNNHPNCAFADSASTVMCGALISLTPCMAAKVDRQPDLDQCAEFKDADDMIHEDPFWQDRVEKFYHGFTNHPGLLRLLGHGRKVRTLPNGLALEPLEVLPRHISHLQSIQQIVRIQRKGSCMARHWRSRYKL